MILIKEIFKSNFHVAKVVLSPKLNISPTIVTITTNLKSDFDKTILANSITLTPGTLTLDMTEEKLIIHCLEENSIKDLQNSIFENILLKKEELNNG
ncbi:Na(+)/H(+) antiporter subunit E [bioreactor metagenome]|uniref:Na(+)/H(+) antiporter subunit E n=1 Tax=bioreactor metagenome TaxID=1076179 RepID=A0A645IFH1_9ZZZZ